MKRDISPLCINHDTAMNHDVFMVDVEGIQSRLELYSCGVIGCDQKYSMKHGYFRGTLGQSIEESTNVKRCLECREHLYLASRGHTMEDTIWLCSNEICSSNVTGGSSGGSYGRSRGKITPKKTKSKAPRKKNPKRIR